MSIAQRALAPRELPESERSLAEQYRLMSEEYVKAAREAWMLEELKTPTLEQYKDDLIGESGTMTDAKAERQVKASERWRDYIRGMVDAKARAESLRQKLEVIRYREREVDRRAWNQRIERTMGRSMP